MTEQTYFWTFAIVPVQTYISEARRSRDLLAGSSILAVLCLEVIDYLKQDPNRAQVLIPYLDDTYPATSLCDRFKAAIAGGDSISNPRYSIPNRATGYIRLESNQAPEVFGRLSSVLLAKWGELFDCLGKGRGILLKEDDRAQLEAFQHLQNTFTDQSWRAGCPLQLIWAATPVDVSPDSTAWEEALPANVQKVDEIFQSVKMSRLPHLRKGETIGKCTLCAKRETMGPTNWKDSRKFWADWENLGWVKNKEYRVNKQERLCAPCLGRRMLGYCRTVSFPSTSKIAARVWLQNPGNLAAKNLLFEQIRNIVGGSFDDPSFDRWPLLYPRTYSARKLQDIKLGECSTALNIAYKQFRQQLGLGAITKPSERLNVEIARFPSNYLAVLLFDGDDMGRHVSQNPDAISKSINGFGKLVRQNVISYEAEPFYIGGDEGLILVPLANSLALACNLQKFFNAVFVGQATLSSSISFFDRERPLGDAIEAAHSAMHSAKQLEGKSALSVSVETASGNFWNITAHWGVTWDFIQSCVTFIAEAELSSSWIYDVQQLFEMIPPGDINSPERLDLLAKEICRLASRSFIPGLSELRQKEILTCLYIDFIQIHEARIPKEHMDLVKLIHLIAFLAREGGCDIVYPTHLSHSDSAD